MAKIETYKSHVTITDEYGSKFAFSNFKDGDVYIYDCTNSEGQGVCMTMTQFNSAVRAFRKMMKG